MADPVEFYFRLSDEGRPPFVPLAEQMHESFSWLLSRRARSRGADVLNVIDTVVVHATAGYATQHAIDRWRQVKASAHWIVPDEDEPQHGHFVWATFAEAKAAYHVRDSIDPAPVIGPGRNVNNRSLGIEIVNTHNVQNFSDPYSQWQIESAARIVLYACAKYPNLRHVISHARLDPTRRSDPGQNFPWETFKTSILDHAALIEPDPLVNTPYTPPMPIAYTGNC